MLRARACAQAGRNSRGQKNADDVLGSEESGRVRCMYVDDRVRRLCLLLGSRLGLLLKKRLERRPSADARSPHPTPSSCDLSRARLMATVRAARTLFNASLPSREHLPGIHHRLYAPSPPFPVSNTIWRSTRLPGGAIPVDHSTRGAGSQEQDRRQRHGSRPRASSELS